MTGLLALRTPVLLLLATIALIGQTSRPAISAIANAASYTTGPVAPGEMVVLFGSGLGPGQLAGLQLNAQGKVASALSGVQVLFDDVAAPLIYTSQAQIAAMVPYSVAGKTTTQVRVKYAGVSSEPFQNAVASTAPGVFSSNASGKGQGAISNSDGSSNSSSNPAAPGSYVTTYLTGEGQTNPSGTDGSISTGAANVIASVSVRIAGRPAQVLYAGSAPGNVNGFAQVNAIIPADLPFGGSLPIVVQIGEVQSQPDITIAVTGPQAPPPGIPLLSQPPTPARNAVLLNWNLIDALAIRVHVERRAGTTGAFGEVAVLEFPMAEFTDTSVLAGQTYQYRVRAQNSSGYSDYSAVVSATVPPSQPTAPSNVRAVAVSPTQVLVTWDSSNTNGTLLQIERKDRAAGSFNVLSIVPSNATSFQDSSVVANTLYWYRMRMQGTAPPTGYSNEAAVTTPAAPPIPNPVLSGTALSATQSRLTWTSTAVGVVRFRIERRTAGGQYIEINQTGPTTTTFDDIGLIASTTYLYRVRSQGSTDFSAFSNEATISTPPMPLPQVPSITATAISASQIRLSWSSQASGVVRFRVERRTSASQYIEIAQPGPSATGLDDVGLSAATAYSYRLRVETGAGLSSYSNEITATTQLGLPAAPTNLRASSPTTTEAVLTWTNNAQTATSIRVESRPAGSGTFTDIGPAATLSSSGVVKLQAGTSYTFRVRAQNAAGFSEYSNESTVTTLQNLKTVFLVHGLRQSPTDLKNLAVNIESSYGVGRGRFASIDYGFDFSDCSGLHLLLCNSNCSLSSGAQRLAQYIANKNPPGDIVLIGFSMGGLLARDVIANSRIPLNGRKVTLVTIGTPNLGYPYWSTDSLWFCSALVASMDGDWRSKPDSIQLSPYLFSLTNQWASKGFPGGSGEKWLAASGRAYSDPKRGTTGCRDQNPYSDGVVCDDSASYIVNTPSTAQPTDRWRDPVRVYIHSDSDFTKYILGDGSDPRQYLKLWDPPPNGTLFYQLITLLNGL